MEEYQQTIEFIRDLIEPSYDVDGIIRNRFFVYDRIADQRLFNEYNDLVRLSQSRNALFRDLGFLQGDIYFYYTEYQGIDAFGGVQMNGLPIVCVSNALFERLYRYCMDLGPRLHAVLAMRQIRLDVNNVFGAPLESFLFSCAVNFLYCHESAHVIQNQGYNVVGNLDSENTARSNELPFLLNSHINELDADRFGFTMVCKDVLRYFGQDLSVENRTADNLADLLSMVLLGISTLFHVLSNELTLPFYLRVGTHPHQAIRIKSAVEIFESTLSSYEVQRLREEQEPEEHRRFQNVSFLANVERLLNTYVVVISHVLGTNERFLEHLFSANRPGEIQNYLDEMFEETLQRPHTLIARNIG